MRPKKVAKAQNSKLTVEETSITESTIVRFDINDVTSYLEKKPYKRSNPFDTRFTSICLSDFHDTCETDNGTNIHMVENALDPVAEIIAANYNVRLRTDIIEEMQKNLENEVNIALGTFKSSNKSNQNKMNKGYTDSDDADDNIENTNSSNQNQNNEMDKKIATLIEMLSLPLLQTNETRELQFDIGSMANKTLIESHRKDSCTMTKQKSTKLFETNTNVVASRAAHEIWLKMRYPNGFDLRELFCPLVYEYDGTMSETLSSVIGCPESMVPCISITTSNKNSSKLYLSMIDMDISVENIKRIKLPSKRLYECGGLGVDLYTEKFEDAIIMNDVKDFASNPMVFNQGGIDDDILNSTDAPHLTEVSHINDLNSLSDNEYELDINLDILREDIKLSLVKQSKRTSKLKSKQTNNNNKNHNQSSLSQVPIPVSNIQSITKHIPVSQEKDYIPTAVDLFHSISCNYSNLPMVCNAKDIIGKHFNEFIPSFTSKKKSEIMAPLKLKNEQDLLVSLTKNHDIKESTIKSIPVIKTLLATYKQKRHRKNIKTSLSTSIFDGFLSRSKDKEFGVLKWSSISDFCQMKDGTKEIPLSTFTVENKSTTSVIISSLLKVESHDNISPSAGIAMEDLTSRHLNDYKDLNMNIRVSTPKDMYSYFINEFNSKKEIRLSDVHSAMNVHAEIDPTIDTISKNNIFSSFLHYAHQYNTRSQWLQSLTNEVNKCKYELRGQVLLDSIGGVDDEDDDDVIMCMV